MTDSIRSLLSEYETPFYVLDTDAVSTRYKTLSQTLPCTVKYASKANFDPQIITTLNNQSCEFVCGSAFEAAVCYKYGVEPANLQVTAVAPSKKSINILTQLANEDDRFTTTVNSVSTVQQLIENGYAGHVLLRLPPDVDEQAESKYQHGSQIKFGLRENELAECITLLEQSEITLEGIHAHMGGTFTDDSIDTFRNHITRTLETATQLDTEITTVNFGGGLGIPYHPDDTPTSIETVAKVLSEYMTDEYEFVLEPGRYIVGPAGTLVTSVRTTRETENGRFVGVDAGMAEFPRPTFFDVYHHIERYTDDPSDTRSSCSQTIAGPTCSGADIFASDRTLERLEVGDIVVINDVGAYGQVLASNFHAYPMPTVVSTSGEQSPPMGDVVDISDTFDTEL